MTEVLFSNEHLKSMIMRSLEKKFENYKLSSQGNKIVITKPKKGGEAVVAISKEGFKISPKLSKSSLTLWVILGAITIHLLNQFPAQFPKVFVLLGIVGIMICIVGIVAQLTRSNTKSEQLAEEIKKHLEEELG